jgi:hypothetical protein
MLPGPVEATANFVQAALVAKAEFNVNMFQRPPRSDVLNNSVLTHWFAEWVFDWRPVPDAYDPEIRPLRRDAFIFSQADAYYARSNLDRRCRAPKAESMD